MFEFSIDEKCSLTFSEDGKNELLCPNCHGNNLHQTTLQVVSNHEGENDLKASTTITEKGKLKKKYFCKNDTRNSRGILYILFWCENCGRDSPVKALELMQLDHSVTANWLYAKTETR